MPIYIYSNPDNPSEVIEVVQGMNEPHEYIKDNIKWNRVFVSPNYAVDSVNIDPFNSKDFVKATNKKGTIGSLMDRSKELSEKRKDKLGGGIDPIQEKWYDNYAATRKKKHPDVKKRELKKKLDKAGFILE